MVQPVHSRIYEIVNSELLELDLRELMLVYEMIWLIKQPKETKKSESGSNLPFLRVQEALKGITRNLSDNINNIERADRL